ncbi:MAG: ABC transporter permease subunit [Propionibacteriaceae bacterium]|nr:ABC transporter permease subunit [Propionibacteriaceae bacterium]
MNAAILRRGLADGWRGLTIASASIAAMLLLALWMYQDIDLTIYQAMPEAVLKLMGVPADADPAIMAYSNMLSAFGALAFCGVAIAVGAHAVAGEEASRTLHITLGAPISRVGYAATKALAFTLLVVGAGALLWGAAEVAPHLVGIGTGDAHLFALMLHLTGAALFHGALAFGVGAATGRKGLAGGVAAGVMLLGWLAAGLLPMWKEGAADWVPWTWFEGTKPLVNGIDGGHVALLLGGALLFLAVGVAVFSRRELRLHQGGAPVLARFRELPVVGKLLAPTGSGGSLFTLRLSANRTLLVIVSVLLAGVMGFSMGPMYAFLADKLGSFVQGFPPTMLAMFGGGDLSSPAGFLHLETMGMAAPVAVIIVAVAYATAGVAGEEKHRRLSILLAHPISRARVYWTTAAVMAVAVLIVGVLLFAGFAAGILLSNLDVDLGFIAQGVGLLVLLGWLFGALALAVSAGTGGSGAGVWTATGVAVVTYFGATLLAAAERSEWAWWSPFHAYLYGPPFQQGVEWWQPTWLAVGAVGLVLAGLPLFLRRDLR